MDTSLDGNAAAGALGDLFAFDVTIAVSTCAACGDGRPVAELRALYRSAAEREMREQIIWLISESEDDSAAALDILIEIARNDPDREMRSKAVFWIGESDDPRAEELLLEILGQGGRR